MEIGCWQSLRHRRSLPVRGNAPRPTPAPARAPRRPSPARRGKEVTPRWPSPSPPVAAGPMARAQERRLRRRPHQVELQQHDHQLHRPGRQRPVVSLGRQRRLRGSRKSTPFAAADGARSLAARRAMEHGVRKVDVQVKGPGSGRGPPSARSRTRASRSPASRMSPSRTTAAARPSGGVSEVTTHVPLHGPKARVSRRPRQHLGHLG